MGKKSAKKVTPMMAQYLEVRRKLPADTLLLFRLGDFYEMFDEDARTGAEILGITLTQRNGQPMAGIPYHAANAYLQKVLARGKKVAIVDQVETPQPGKIVKRALTRILTPGTTLEDHQQEATANQYLLAVDVVKGHLAGAWLDLSTGEFVVAQAEDPGTLLPVFASLDPREVLVPEAGARGWPEDEALAGWAAEFATFCDERSRTELPDFHFDPVTGARAVTEALGVLNLEGFGLELEHPGLGPAGALLSYATETLTQPPKNLHTIRPYRVTETLLLDPATQRNLEIFRSSRGQREGSLLAAMDATRTAPGARLLERWLAAPVLDIEEIRRRQRTVGELVDAPAETSELREYLRFVRDLPRILGRLQNRLRNPRELGGVRDTLRQLPIVRELLAGFDTPELGQLAARLEDFPALRERLEAALVEELPNHLLEGGYIDRGHDAELDRLRDLGRDAKQWLAQFEAEEQQRTGIRNLKVKYNGAFGYFIEITKSNLGLVPDDYTRKQTMTNAERFTTPGLKAKEKEILSAEEKALAREEELFAALVANVLEAAEPLRATAEALAELDLFAGWAELARRWDYNRPEVDDSHALEIEAGRHPVVEQQMRAQDERRSLDARTFVPNDTALDAAEAQVALITGPNMAGKSTYIRQVALITLMAQVGCWVPAKRCRVGLVDRIFSRIGASDELVRGNSTFMVEMNETANILNNATVRSLVILDEIGRGTSTYDGLSIAWAVVEHLHGVGKRGARTLFATHYHEITQIAAQLPRVRNYCVAVKEWNDRILFVRQVLPGAADRSYGIQVARLAGLPPSVVARAKEILDKLEADSASQNVLRKRMKKGQGTGKGGNGEAQGELF